MKGVLDYEPPGNYISEYYIQHYPHPHETLISKADLDATNRNTRPLKFKLKKDTPVQIAGDVWSAGTAVRASIN